MYFGGEIILIVFSWKVFAIYLFGEDILSSIIRKIPFWFNFFNKHKFCRS